MSAGQFRNAMEAIRRLSDTSPPWDDLLQGAKDIVGADAATLIMFDQGRDLLLLKQTGIDESAEREYTEYYYKHDAFAQAALSGPAGLWWDSSILRATTDAQQRPFYTDYMPRHKLGQVLAFVIAGEPERRTAISFQRMTADPSAVEKMSRGQVATFIQALVQAIAAREKAGSVAYASLDTALSGMGEAVFVASANGKLYRCSVDAYLMLERARMLSGQERALAHPNPEVYLDLLSALSRSARLKQHAKVSVLTSWGEGLRLDILPAPDSLRLASETVLLVRIQRASIFSGPEAGELAPFFSITPAEAKTLSALIHGHSPKEQAMSAGLSEHTVRHHIASLMKKMSCNRQSELVRLGSLVR